MAKDKEKDKEEKKETQPSETETKYRKLHKEDQNAFWRQVNFVYAKKVANKSLTHEQFCDAKIKAYTEHWTERKKHPHKTAQARFKVKTKEDVQRMKDIAAKALARAKAAEEAVKEFEAAGVV